MLRPGDRVGDWLVDAVLGEGGMGAVYRVHSVLTGRLEAALKVMKPSLEPEARVRFVREAEALSSLRHPAIVRVMGFGEDESRRLLYLAMELAEGPTLKARLQRGPLTLPEALRIFRPLASALEHAHESGLFHRDLKPANVVLCLDGTVRLVDFGIAAAQSADTLTHAGHLGTLAYLAPEIFRGERPEPAPLDVYAFGLMIHEALTGSRPFLVDPGLTPAAAAAAVGVKKLNVTALEPGPTFPEGLRDVVRRATDPDPRARPTMKELRANLGDPRRAGPATGAEATPLVPLASWAEEHTISVPDMPRTGKTPRRWADRRGADRRRVRRWGAALLLMAGAAAVGFALTWSLSARGRATEPSPAASPTPSPMLRSGPPTGAVRPRRAPSPAAEASPSSEPQPFWSTPAPAVSPSPSPRPSPPPVVAPTPDEPPFEPPFEEDRQLPEDEPEDEPEAEPTPPLQAWPNSAGEGLQPARDHTSRSRSTPIAAR